MITITIALVNKFLLDSDDDVYIFCIISALIDGIIAWCVLTDVLIAAVR